ncbi:hypothetical protein V496_07229 [Pseudogymnoascus sp. VKM F-4515 (FW-2607)]|nr:hypothetical protein V496_07229 [Pseudogymnoascus sp. VKM F-4515 (FW-2607)]KFY80256.1 hypothetical protein V498_08823 [Pseudogymnoascus sp. VKM F-4517 (FW-2822)]
MAAYDTNTVAQLKALLRDRGLPVSGTKATLIQRLQDQDRLKASEQGDSNVEGPLLKDDSDDDDGDGDFRPQGDADEEDEEETDNEDEEETDNEDEEETNVEQSDITAKAEANGDEEGSDCGSDLLHSDVEEENRKFTEVILKDGSIERIILSDEPDDEMDKEELEKGILGDPVYKMLNDRRKLRMSIVILTGEANSKIKDQTEFDFSDAASTLKFPPKTLKFIPCSAGRFVQVYKDKQWKYVELKDHELLKYESQAGQPQCECEICKKRRKNSETFGEGELRSGNTRGWTKYGVGRVLGGGEGSGEGGR